VADVFDALTSARPYKDAMSPTATLEIMGKGSGTQFDPEIYAALLRRMNDVLKVYSEQADLPVKKAA
jgi:putative two-component system response regulator